MLVELLRPAGTELARRWLAALLCVPMSEREQVVAAIEARIAETYLAGKLPSAAAEVEAARIKREEDSERSTAAEAAVRPRHADDDQTLRVAYPPTQKPGYVEQEFREYAVQPDEAEAAADKAKPADKKTKKKSKGA